MTPEPSPTPALSSRGKLAIGLLFATLFATVLGLVVAFELDPTAQPQPKLPWRNGRLNHQDVIVLSMVLTTLGGLFAFALRGARTWGRAARIALAALVFVAGLNYFYVRMGLHASQFAHRWDTFHYLLGPRYYAELDYDDLYACALSEITTRQIPDSRPVRDLRTYNMRKAGEIRAEQPCTENFSVERRERWRADLKLFTEHGGIGTLRGAIEDRGYNGSPFHSAVAGYIADRIVLTEAAHQLVPMLDVAVICTMAAGVTWAFGWELGLVFALFFFTSAADRWGIIGGSFFRFPWMASLALSLAALRARRHATAGVLMAISTLLNVFPVVFSFGLLLRAGVQTVRDRSFPVPYRRFFAAAILTGLLGLGVGALPARGPGNYVSWFQNMELHNVERYQGFGVGLKFPFIFRGGVSDETDRVPERTRKAWFREVRPWYMGLAAIVLGLAGAVALKTEDDVEAAGIVGFTLFFSVLGTVGYYFTCAAVMVLALHRRAREPMGAALLALFFLTSLIAHFALHQTLYYRFMYNTVLSTGWSVWLLLVLGWLAWRVGVFRSWRSPAP